MADIDGRLIPRNPVELAVNLRFRNRVEGGGRLIEDDEGRVLVKRPGDSDLLGLAAGNLYPILCKLPVEHGVQPAGHRGQPFAEARVDERLLRPCPIILLRPRDICAERLRDQLEVLEDDGEDAQIVAVAVLADVDAV